MTDITSFTEPPLRARSAWSALQADFDAIGHEHLRTFFADDPDRGQKMTAEGVGLYLDYSKQRVTDKTMSLLMQLARESHVEEHRDAMFAGEHINVSEDRAVLHIALRL